MTKKIVSHKGGRNRRLPGVRVKQETMDAIHAECERRGWTVGDWVERHAAQPAFQMGDVVRLGESLVNGGKVRDVTAKLLGAGAALSIDLGATRIDISMGGVPAGLEKGDEDN